MTDRFIEAQMVRKRAVSLSDRETLAEIAHRKKCAKHKGRNHWKNWERRQMAQLKREAAAKSAKKRNSVFKKFNQEVAAYWCGLRSDLPRKPLP